MDSLTLTLVLLGMVGLVANFGCDTTVLAASSTAKVFERAAPAFQEYWDYDLAGQAAPGSIIQLEGVLRVVPEEERVLLRLISAYVGYTFGFIEDDIEVADFAGDLDEADRQRGRARMFYRRARDLAAHWLSIDHEGYVDAAHGPLSDFEAYLTEEFDDPEDAIPLLWAGYAWGSYINMSKSDMGAVAELPYARTLVERSVALDEHYYHGAGTTFLAVVATNAVGADMDVARETFDHALELTERHNFLVQVNMARHWAVKNNDRELFLSLLREVIEGGDPEPTNRLANRIAYRRAERYLEHIDDLF